MKQKRLAIKLYLWYIHVLEPPHFCVLQTGYLTRCESSTQTYKQNGICIYEVYHRNCSNNWKERNCHRHKTYPWNFFWDNTNMNFHQKLEEYCMHMKARCTDSNYACFITLNTSITKYLRYLSWSEGDLTRAGDVVLPRAGWWGIRQTGGTPDHGTVGQIWPLSLYLYFHVTTVFWEAVFWLRQVHHWFCQPNVKTAYIEMYPSSFSQLVSGLY